MFDVLPHLKASCVRDSMESLLERNIIHLICSNRETTLANICFPPWSIEVYIKNEELFYRRANSFLLDQMSFQKGLGLQKSKLEVTKVTIFFIKQAENLQNVLPALNMKHWFCFGMNEWCIHLSFNIRDVTLVFLYFAIRGLGIFSLR